MGNNGFAKIETLRFTSDITQPALILVASVLLFCLGIEMVLHGIYEAWFLIGLFGLAIAACLISILPGSCFIEIDGTGLKVVSRFRETTFHWSQIDRIGIFEIGIVKRIGIDLNASYAGPERVPNHMKSASGYHVTLPHVTGMELENLRDILHECLTKTSLQHQPENKD